MSEIEVYGATVWSSSGYDTGNANVQLPLFVFSKQAHLEDCWLKDIASAADFCYAGGNGESNTGGASGAGHYVRPRFIIA